MSNTLALRTALALMALLTACTSPLPGARDPQPLPSPAGDWSMTLSQTGGFAGVNLTVEVSSDGWLTAQDQRSGRKVTQALPSEAVARLARFYSDLRLVTPNAPHSNCADCFNYDLQASASGAMIQIHADDTTLSNSGAGDLIAYLCQLRDTALRAQP